MAFLVAGFSFALLAVVSLGMSALVFRFGPGKRLNRMMAAFLLITGASAAGAAFASFRSDADMPYEHWAFVAAGHLADAGLLLNVGLVAAWARPHALPGWLSRVTPWLLAAAALSWLVLFLPAAESIAWQPVMGFVPVALLWYAGRETDPGRRHGGLLIGYAFFIPLLYNAYRDGLGVATLLYEILFLDSMIVAEVGAAIIWSFVLGTSILLAAMIVGGRLLWRHRPRRFGWPLLILVLVALSGLFDTFAGMVRDGFIDFPVEFTFDALLGPYAFWNAIAVVILAYAVLSGQVPGIDVAFRMGISRSSMAAVFIAVFFIASEAAQAFFGDRLQNEYFGIAAAGLLVLGIAPLQRVADQFAVRALPPAAPAQPRHAEYLTLLRKIMLDGRVTADEERALAAAATAFGITAKEAFDMRQAVMEKP